MKIDTFNVGLAGAFLPYEADRRGAVADAVAASDADILCLQEVWRQSDKDLILDASQDAFPNTVWFEHDLDTKVDDATDQNGNVPPEPTAAPCSDPDTLAAMNEAIDCLAQNCSTVMGSDEGQTTSTACAEQYCTASAAALLAGGDAGLRCYGCLAPSLPVEKLKDIRTSCSTDPNAGLAFGGQSGVMILSKHPISGGEARVLPGTWNRRVILHGQVAVPGAESVHVYCNHISPVFDGVTYPYTGPYGNGDTGKGGWAAEQLLQAEKLIAMVEEQAPSETAVILGDFNSSVAYEKDGKIVVRAEAAATLGLLKDAFVEAVVSDYEPICTYCKDNLVNGGDSDEWLDHIFLSNKDLESVVSTERILTDRSVASTDENGMSIDVELSDHFGMRAVVELSPASE